MPLGQAKASASRTTALRELEWVRQLGTEIRCNTVVGRDVTVQSLLDDYDAVFVGGELAGVGPLDLPGKSLPEVRDVLDFMADLRGSPPIERRSERADAPGDQGVGVHKRWWVYPGYSPTGWGPHDADRRDAAVRAAGGQLAAILSRRATQAPPHSPASGSPSSVAAILPSMASPGRRASAPRVSTSPTGAA